MANKAHLTLLVPVEEEVANGMGRCDLINGTGQLGRDGAGADQTDGYVHSKTRDEADSFAYASCALWVTSSRPHRDPCRDASQPGVVKITANQRTGFTCIPCPQREGGGWLPCSAWSWLVAYSTKLWRVPPTHLGKVAGVCLVRGGSA